MNLELIGETLDVLGKIMVSFTVVAVHYRFRKEHKVDEQVFKIMQREQGVAVIGIVLMVIGYFLRLPMFV